VIPRTNEVACIIPVRNGEATIARAINSAVEAGATEVLVYDDASTDGTRQILEGLCQSTPELEFYSMLHTVRAGVNFARNFLIEMAYAPLIVCLDADDELHSLAPLLDAWQPGTFVYGDYLEHSGNEVNRIKAAPPGSLTRKNITGVTFMFHQSDWQRVGGFDPDFAYAEDFGLQCALVNGGVQARQIDAIVYSRYLKPEGNQRTALAGTYWQFYRDMARRKYPVLFAGTV